MRVPCGIGQRLLHDAKGANGEVGSRSEYRGRGTSQGCSSASRNSCIPPDGVEQAVLVEQRRQQSLRDARTAAIA